MKNRRAIFLVLLFWGILAFPFTHEALSKEIVAVAAGIAPSVEEVLDLYVSTGGAPLSVVTGPSGTLAKQIEAGAPYGMVLMSEPRWPAWMKEKGLLIDLHTFAIGQLVLWAPDETPDLDGLSSKVIALPDPEITAYGMLTKNYLTSIGLWESFISGNVVITKSAPQAILVAAGGGADWAFSSKPMAIKTKGIYIVLEGALIEQKGGLTTEAGPDSVAFWEFCRSPEANLIWEKWGFILEGRN